MQAMAELTLVARGDADIEAFEVGLQGCASKRFNLMAIVIAAWESAKVRFFGIIYSYLTRSLQAWHIQIDWPQV